MHGAGNDYVYVDLFQEELPAAPEKLAPIIADRHFGVGGDGLVLICPSDIADARMRMFNLDGSESEMCGNAIRCVAKYVAERKTPRPDRLRVATGAGRGVCGARRRTGFVSAQCRVSCWRFAA